MCIFSDYLGCCMDIYHIGAILSIILSFFALVGKLKPILSKLNELLELQKLQSDSLRDLLRQHIIEKTNEIFKRGFITEEEIYCARKLYDDYKKLGGNSTVDIRFKKAMELPIRKNEILEG